jgi:hypothetical protein
VSVEARQTYAACQTSWQGSEPSSRNASGDTTRAADEAEALLREAVDRGAADSGEMLDNVACLYSQLAKRAAADPATPVDDRAGGASQYADRAMEVLGQARDAGFFQNPAHADDMKRDTDLDALRTREDYEKLLREVDK